MVYIGVDLHQRFCMMTAVDTTGKQIAQGRVANERAALEGYFARWKEPVAVAVEACSFWPAFADTVQPQVARLVLVHPLQVKAIAHAKLKNDRVDSQTLAQLLRSDFLPEAWIADPATRELRRWLRLRVALGQQRTQWKNRIHALLHQWGLRAPGSDLFGRAGQQWLDQQVLPELSREVLQHSRGMLQQVEERMRGIEQKLRSLAAADGDARNLMTIPGVGAYTALVLKAEIGDVHRFRNKRALCRYAGLVPAQHQSADHQRRGGITRQGSALLRWVMCEAATSAVNGSPAARAYFERLAQEKPKAVARVALARKLLAAVYRLWHDGVCFDEQIFAAM